ncbi:MFS transporter [Pedobacter sp. L105]|uniref:MFS transporter n=1 Tax=Pedobacter sp. L105 TaxID=1641871 RepID=UPI00131BFBC4|nr:MFS transporter [Pedobacter sp. L105]
MSAQVKKEAVSYRFMLPLVLGTMMNPLNSTMLATALIPLCNSFKVSVGQGAILITSLYVTSTIAQPVMGRLADLFSAKKINTLGFILVMIAAIIGVVAPSISWLVVSRIILGLGTSAAYPSAMALINRKYAQANKPVPGNVLGIVAISSQVSMILGPVLGGLLTQYLGWKGIFFINIPWVLLAVYLSRAIPDYPAAPITVKESLFKKLDVIGILIFSLFLLSFMFLFIQRPFMWELIIPPVLLLILLIVWERKEQTPFIDVRLLADRPALLLVYLRTLATNYVLYIMLYALPQWIEGIKHLQPAKTGLMMLPDSIVAIGVGLLISKSTKLFRQNLLGVVFMVITCIGFYLLNAQVSIFMIFILTIILGVAEGLNMIANQALLNIEAPLAQKGVSFGLYRTFGYLGAILSSTQLKTLFHEGITDQRFHQLSYTVGISCSLLILLLIPLWIRRRSLSAAAQAPVS